MGTDPSEDSEGGQTSPLVRQVLNTATKVLKAFYNCSRCDEFAVAFELLLPEVTTRRGIFRRQHTEHPRRVTRAWRTDQAVYLDDGRKVRLYLTYQGALYMRVESHTVHGQSLPLQVELDEGALGALNDRSLRAVVSILEMQIDHLEDLNKPPRVEADEQER